MVFGASVSIPTGGKQSRLFCLLKERACAMEFREKPCLILAASALLLMVSCSSTTLTRFSSVWRDEAYQGHPVKIMVVCIPNGLADRRIFEDELVGDVTKHGAEAVASYSVLLDSSVTDTNAISMQAESAGADAVLTSEVMSTEASAVEFPWERNEDSYINIQTNLYATKANRLVWTASTRTWQRQGLFDKVAMRSVVRSITKKMSQQGLLKPEPPDIADKEGAIN